jgi:acyl-coenzyme A synthetase/AMP-(fatty) acid ligase
VALRLLDAHERDVPPGEIGQVVVRTPDTMVGYWNDTLASFAVLRDGWMRTGDLARADDQGYLWLEGRMRDLIIRDGSNVAPAEVETVALNELGVTAAAAIGLPDPPRGEAVHLFVVAGQAPADDLRSRIESALRSKLRPVAVPSVVHIVPELPLNQAGKVDKSRLRATLSD